ncbi:MAG: FAD:protein FMN transferase [Gammaproteobacteria bacterium]|nr:MAG: FAD:protein FMN transferase [Gammaproteobacteria bacterium]
MSGLLFLGLIVFLLLNSGCSRQLPSQYFRLLSFGTLVELEVIGVDERRAREAYETLQQDFTFMHHTWHAWKPGPLGRVNEAIAEGRTIAAPPSVLPLLKVSQKLAAKSDYLFDPGIGKLIELWGFHKDNLQPHAPPPAEKIAAILAQHPSIRDVHLDGFHLACDNPTVKLDFGAIGKGYGIDRAIERLKEMGITDAIVNAGGDLRAIGSRDGNPWRIAIRDPDGGGIFALLSVSGDEAVFTSGNYERNFTWEGKFYHHIIDPRTGYPAEGTASVTVLHPDATTADAAATALFIAGPKNWYRIARQMGVKFVLLIDTQGEVYMNPAMQKRVELQKPVAEIHISKPL